MKTFKDLKGRAWNLRITVASVKRVRSSLNIDITDFENPEFITTLANDFEKMVDMMWVLLEAQAEKIRWKEEGDDKDTIGVSQEEFGEGFAGDVIDEATKAFIDELTDFFPEKKRGATRKLFKKTGQVVEKGFQKVEAEIDNMDVEEILREAFGKKD